MVIGALFVDYQGVGEGSSIFMDQLTFCLACTACRPARQYQMIIEIEVGDQGRVVVQH